MKINFSRLLAFLTTIIFFCSFSLISHAESQNPFNGNWQYLIKRGDNKGSIGNFGDASCPFYVGYFTLDFHKVKGKNQKEAYTFGPDDMEILPVSSTEAFHVTRSNQEQRGSYTPVENNAMCRMPSTKALEERAPITINSVAPNYSSAEWVTVYNRGTYKQDVFWKTKAKYISATDEIHGDLKAYMCAGKENKGRCTVLNSTKFVAKRIKSIEEASQKPLSAQFPEFKLKPGELVSLMLQNFVEASDLGKFANASYIKPSIKAVFPSYAQSSGEGSVQRAACAGGQCWCLGGANSACVKCKWVNCPGKEGQAAPAGREELCNDKYTEGRCYDITGQISCSKYGNC